MGLILRNNAIIKNLVIGGTGGSGGSGGDGGGGGGSSEPSYFAGASTGYNSSQGAVYIYDATDFTATPTQLLQSDSTTGNKFGESLAISGDTIAVGSWRHNSNQGAIYVYDGTNLSASPTKVSTGGGSDQFAKAIAVTSNYLIGGAPNDDDAASNAGNVHVYSLSNLSASPTVLSAPDAGGDDKFGVSVAANDSYLVVGAKEWDGSNSNQGTIYVYDITDLSASPTQVSPSGLATNEEFGTNIAINGSTIVVGSNYGSTFQGRVYVYDATNLSASPTVLTAPDNANYDQFGESVAISSDHIVVGALYNDDDGTNSGAAYVYDRSDLSASPTKLTEPNSNAAAQKQFGKHVSAAGSLIAISSTGPSTSSSKGVTYVYDATDLTAAPTQITPSGAVNGDNFGDPCVLG